MLVSLLWEERNDAKAASLKNSSYLFSVSFILLNSHCAYQIHQMYAYSFFPTKVHALQSKYKYPLVILCGICSWKWIFSEKSAYCEFYFPYHGVKFYMQNVALNTWPIMWDFYWHICLGLKARMGSFITDSMELSLVIKSRTRLFSSEFVNAITRKAVRARCIFLSTAIYFSEIHTWFYIYQHPVGQHCYQLPNLYIPIIRLFHIGSYYAMWRLVWTK